MADLASAELKLVKHKAVQSSPLQNNLVLALNTAAKTGVFLGATARDTVLLELSRAQAALSSAVSKNPLLPLLKVTRTANTTLAGGQHGSVIFAFSRCRAIESNVIHATPALVTATLTGKHVGNTLPSTPRPLGIQKAEIVSDTSPLVRTFLVLSSGLIAERGVYNGIRNSKELQFLIRAVSQTALPQGQAGYNLGKGTLANASVVGGERPGKEQILFPSQRTSSAITQTQPELLRATKEGQMPQGGESKFDERLTIETEKSGAFDEQIILIISRAREFMEQDLLRSQRDESLVETHQRLELMKAVIENIFVETGSRVGKELSPDRYQTDQSTVNIQPQLRLMTAAVSDKFEGAERTEKLRQFGLSSSTVTESQDIANMLLRLRNAAITGKIIGKDLPAVPLEFSLLRSPVRNSNIVSQMDSPFHLLRGMLSGVLFGSGNQHGISELVYNTGMWIGSFRFDEIVFLWGANSTVTFDLKIQLIPCGSFDESIVVARIGYAAADETVSLARAMSYDSMVELAPCRSLDEIISLRRADSGPLDEQVNLLRNYMESVKVDEMIVVIARAWCDQVIVLTATPAIIDFDESLLTERSSLAKVDEAIDLTMTYYPPTGGAVDSYLRNLEFDESILILKPEFDECITITNNHNVALLGDVIRDSDLKAKGIIIYAGQDFVLEQ